MRESIRWLCVLVILCLAGCHSGRNVMEFQGEVTYDGKPIEKGRIDFLPVEGTPGGSAGASIVNGRYAFPPQTGVSVTGVYAVRIIGLKKTGRVQPNLKIPDGPPLDVEENFLPAIYNNPTTLKVRITDIPDPKHVDFHIGKPFVEGAGKNGPGEKR